MIVTIINAIFDSLEYLVQALVILLPVSPFRADGLISDLMSNQFVGWVTIFLPVEFMLLFMGSYIPAVIAYYGVRWGLRIIRKV